MQGAGDDEANWSRGLTPQLFWENRQTLLDYRLTTEECEELVDVIVQRRFSVLEAIGKNSNERPVDEHKVCYNGFILFLILIFYFLFYLFNLMKINATLIGCTGVSVAMDKFGELFIII